MTRIHKTTLLAVGALLAQARPATLPYQGLATDAQGRPKPDATYTINFALYGGSTSTTALWSEGQIVPLRKGLFSVVLGSGTDIPDSLFRRNALFLGLTFSGESELSPRLPLGLPPWAVRSRSADTAAFAKSASGLDSLRNVLSATQDSLKSLTTRLAQLTALLSGVHRQGQNLYFDSVNVNVRNGLGRTDTVNGLGNLVVGYNALRGDTSDHRTGSHTLVVGDGQSFTSYGGIVAGKTNTLKGAYSSVTGGTVNTASGPEASVSGGYGNTASGSFSSVTGGYSNTASFFYTVVSGGYVNTASGNYASVSGGSSNTASGSYSSVSAGYGNTPSGSYASVSGGILNTASANYSSVSGGGDNVASSARSSVSGGEYNLASGSGSSVGGGLLDTASGVNASVAGGGANKASGELSTVTGGESNTASGVGANVRGGSGVTVATKDGYLP